MPRDPAGDSWDESRDASWTDVGAFEQGTPFSRWALARYLVGHAVADALGRGLLILAALFVALCVVTARWAHAPFWAVLLGLIAAALLAARAVLAALSRRLLPLDAAAARELRTLVRATRSDVLAELRRLGLPGRTWTLPLLARRLVGRRRGDTMQRMRRFDIERVVSQSRLDSLHLLLRDATGRPDTLRS